MESTGCLARGRRFLGASGIVALAYSVPGGVGPAPRIGYIKAAKTPAK